MILLEDLDLLQDPHVADSLQEPLYQRHNTTWFATSRIPTQIDKSLRDKFEVELTQKLARYSR